MSGRALSLILVLGAVAAYADRKLELSFKDYQKRSEQATSRKAYERALDRLAEVELGMRSTEFFSRMEMLYLQDSEGRAVDGFCEGHLRSESRQMSEGKLPDHFVIFGYHEDWKHQRRPVEKFYVRFRNKVLQEIAFYDPEDDEHGVAGKLGSP